MKLRYLLVDADDRLRLVPREQVEAVWRGRANVVSAIGCSDLTELRLVSVVSDRRLVPRRIFLLRVALTNGYFTVRDFQVLRSFTMPDRVTATEAIQHHCEGWPVDFFTQMAVALDVPRAMLDVPFGIGGPLLIAAAMRISPQRAVRFLK